MILLFINILFCSISSTPATNINMVYQSSTVSQTSESDKKENRADNTLENTLFGSGVGLIAVGGVGAGVIAHNNKKPKDTPSKTIENPYDEEDKRKKIKK